MLKAAQLYKEQLEKKELESWYDERNIYLYGWAGTRLMSVENNNYNQHTFVSVNKNDEVIGMITYNIDWASMSADKFGIISYEKGNIEFAKDLEKAIYDLFNVYKMNRISWCCYTDNPAIKGYRRFIKKHGGRECGYYRQVSKLMDGKLHDMVDFEIMASEFRSAAGEEKKQEEI